MSHHDDAHAPTHEEHTGHGGHHVLSRHDLLRTFGVLCGLTVLTVGLALAERAGYVPLGPLSVPVALAIAGAKATFVALYFMGLKYDRPTNALAFVSSLIFLVIFLSFTYLDTGFRGTFEPMAAVPVDVLEAERLGLAGRDSLVQEAIRPATLLAAPDTLLLPGARTEPGAAATPAPAAPAPAAPAAAPPAEEAGEPADGG